MSILHSRATRLTTPRLEALHAELWHLLAAPMSRSHREHGSPRNSENQSKLPRQENLDGNEIPMVVEWQQNRENLKRQLVNQEEQQALLTMRAPAGALLQQPIGDGRQKTSGIRHSTSTRAHKLKERFLAVEYLCYGLQKPLLFWGDPTCKFRKEEMVADLPSGMSRPATARKRLSSSVTSEAADSESSATSDDSDVFLPAKHKRPGRKSMASSSSEESIVYNSTTVAFVFVDVPVFQCAFLRILLSVFLPASLTTPLQYQHRSSESGTLTCHALLVFDTSLSTATYLEPLDFTSRNRSGSLPAPPVSYMVLDKTWSTLSASASMPVSTTKERPLPAALCGLGGCAPTQTANPFTLVMQVFQCAFLRILLSVFLPASLTTPLQYQHRSSESGTLTCHALLVFDTSLSTATYLEPLDFTSRNRSGSLPAPPVSYMVLDKTWSTLSASASMPVSTTKERPLPAALCGLGGCAPTQTANPFTLVMQVSKTYSLLAKKSSNYLLFQLPSPHCCVLVALECSRVIRALLMMSGDIESNPGPASNAVLTELQKLSAGQTELISQVQDLKSHLLSTDKSIADLSRRMTDLEGHCQNIISLRTDVEALRRDTARASDLLRKLEARVDEAENHSRRNNLIFYGLPESTGSEALVQVEQLVIKHCRDRLGISIDPKEIERAHRLGRRKGTNHHRPIIVKFAFHKTKGEILSNGRKFKGTTFSVGEDFSRRVQNVRRQLIAFAKTKSLPFSITYKTLLMGHKRYVYDEQSQTVREAS
ncbi:uncharacterized protein LOC142765500 [Rhipicephalus microplus]|uniref:uncharacterized protein LOC142765500 n=4 Tax=Rhipicephalus microplus TaxID=6941 RepID=UPI003F6BADE4